MEINKGNYTIDTAERLKRYMQARAFGCEDAFYEYRKICIGVPALSGVSDQRCL